MDNDIQYFRAVIDTAQLISTWLKNNQDNITKILSSLEINLEAKYGPFTSKLSNQIGINDTLGLKSPDSYWKGVQDTLSLIKNFVNWKELTQSPRSIDNFLLEIVNKSNIRLEPEESPLITALGILFEKEFTFNPKPTNNPSFNEAPIVNAKEEPQIQQPTFVPESIQEVKKEEIEPEPTIQFSAEDPDKAFNSNEFIDDDEFLDQFIRDSTTPQTTPPVPEDLVSSERDYLRSALDELTFSQDESTPEEEINIQFKEPLASNKTESGNEEVPDLSSINIIEDELEEKDNSRLLSSSLRDALRMLREEE